MPTNIITLAETFRTQLIQADAQAILDMTQAWTAVEASLQTAVIELAEYITELKANGQEVSQHKLWQLSRYQSLLAQIANEMGKYNQYAAGVIETESVKAQGLGKKHAQGLILATTGGRLASSFDQLPAPAVENVAAIARAGQPLNTLLENAYPKAVLGLTRELLVATAVGQNPRETARIALRKGLAQGLQHILLVARDQQIRNHREMTRAIYDRSDVVSGYIRLAAKNRRTCLACLALDGTVYQTSELMAVHPQDRCSMIPVVDGFPRPTFETGEAWFRRQPISVQKRMMGPGRYEGWQNGCFRFSQLATIVDHEVWGPSARVTAVGDLLAGGGGV